jgi:hypothetical protein
MNKILEIKGEKNTYKKVYAENFKGKFTFKLIFDDKSKNCFMENETLVFCMNDKMKIEVFSDAIDFKKYDFKVETYKMEKT